MAEKETNQGAAMPAGGEQAEGVLRRGGSVALRVEKWIYGGQGLARYHGQAVFVPFTLPGEEVDARLSRGRQDYWEARLERVVTPSVHRVEPLCPYFGQCGGCHYQHAAYAAQLQAKAEILKETIARIGKLEPPESLPVVAGEPWGYRNRTQFHVVGRHIGFAEPQSHRLCVVDRCPVSSPGINHALAQLRQMARQRRFPEFLRTVELFTNEEQTLVNVLETTGGQRVAKTFFEWCGARIPGAAAGELDYRAAGEVFRVGHNSFFQTNRHLVDALVACALEGAAGRWMVDLYAGVGLFTLPMARRAAEVDAVETGAGAIRDLAYNSLRAQLTGVRCHKQSAEAFLKAQMAPPDFLLADPPRAGLGQAVTEQILRLRPPRVHVVSCNPSTLARDLAALCAGGVYRIEQLTLVDLFPHTYHIESVAKLVLA